MSFFDSMPARFEAVGREPGVGTVAFLDACAALVPIFGALGLTSAFTCTTFCQLSTAASCRRGVWCTDALNSTAFSPVKSDINGTIKVARGGLLRMGLSHPPDRDQQHLGGLGRN
jgi:hypothetical protein